MKPSLKKLPFNRSAGTAITLATALSALLLSTDAMAREYIIEKLVINKVHTFETPPGAQTAGGYLTITNNGTEDDTLVSGTSSFANVTQVHEMKMENNVMKMRHLETGLAIPAGATVELSPGGYHMMFMQLTKTLKDGDSLAASLTFSKAGELPVDFQVLDRRKQDAGHATMTHHKKKDENSHSEESQSMNDESHSNNKDGSMKHDAKSQGSHDHNSKSHDSTNSHD